MSGDPVANRRMLLLGSAGGGAALSAAALSLCLYFDDPFQLFRSRFMASLILIFLAVGGIAAIILWVRDPRERRLGGPLLTRSFATTDFAWVISRIAFLVAAIILGGALLAAWMLNSSAQQLLLQAFLLLLVSSAFIGVGGRIVFMLLRLARSKPLR
jgi:hypothetical protein